MRGTEFLPVSREEMRAREWYYYDFLVVMADAYIDHPSFGSTLIARLLEAEGYRVCLLYTSDAADGLARLHPLYRHGKAPVWRVHRRGQPGQHGGPLHRG